MFNIGKPFPLAGLSLKPEPKGMFQLEPNIIQALASLLGWDGEARQLLTCSVSGALHQTSPRVQGITNDASTDTNQVRTYTDIPTSEVIVLANPNNSGDLWLNIDATPAVDTGYPLDAGDWVKLSINNLMSLQIFVVTSGDKIIILRTV